MKTANIIVKRDSKHKCIDLIIEVNSDFYDKLKDTYQFSSRGDVLYDVIKRFSLDDGNLQKMKLEAFDEVMFLSRMGFFVNLTLE